MISMREISYSGLHYVPKSLLKMGDTVIKICLNAVCFLGVGLYSKKSGIFQHSTPLNTFI